MMLKWVALAALVWTMPASAKNWFLVGMSDTRATAYFIDRDSIVNTASSLRRATAWSVHAANDPDGTASRELVLEFDCATPRYRFLHLTGYNTGLTVLSDEVGSGTWRVAEGGSLDDAARQFVCSRGKKPATAKGYGAGNPFGAGRAALAPSGSSARRHSSH